MMKVIGIIYGSIIILSIYLFNQYAYAYRPLSTEDAGVGSMGEVVIEMAYNLAREGSDRENSGNYALILGLGRGEIGIEGAYIKTPDNERGFGDILLFAKLLLLGNDEKSGIFTLKGEFLWPTADEDKGLGEGDREFGGSAVFSKTLFMLTAHLQAGYNYIKDEDPDTNSLFYGAALDYAIGEKFIIVGEVSGSRSKDEKPVSILGGFVFKFHKRGALDFAVGRGLNKEADDFTLTAGLTFVF